MEIVLVFIIVVIVFMSLMNSLNIFDGIVIVDVFLRILTYLFSFIEGSTLISKVDSVVPNSLLEPITMWSSGIYYQILIGIYILCYAIFLFNIIKKVVKKIKR